MGFVPRGACGRQAAAVSSAHQEVRPSWGQLRYFRSNGDGTFSDHTAVAGLTGIVGGLNDTARVVVEPEDVEWLADFVEVGNVTGAATDPRNKRGPRGLALHASGKRLNRDVLFIATADEEAGGYFGAGWLAEQRPELFEGVGYLLNEGGGVSRVDDNFAISRRGSISGTVTETSGGVVEGVRVYLHGSRIKSTTTDAAGNYQIIVDGDTIDCSTFKVTKRDELTFEIKVLVKSDIRGVRILELGRQN